MKDTKDIIKKREKKIQKQGKSQMAVIGSLLWITIRHRGWQPRSHNEIKAKRIGN